MTTPGRENRPLIIGIGNRDRGDDQVGIRVAEKVQQQLGATVDVIIQRSDPAYLIEQWQGRELVIAIDAVVSEELPEGEIFSWDAANEKLAVESYHASTHNLGIHEAIELARALHKMPKRFFVYGISANTFAVAGGMSAEVEHGAEKAANEILRFLTGGCDA